jgi:5-methylcytosine-specific restriction endonuclease McrA
MAKGIYPRTEKHRAIISASMKGKKRPPFSKEWREKIRLANLGKKRSQETKKRLSVSHLGQKPSEKQRAMMRAKTGEKHPNWRGGISFELYTIDWTETLKRAIRERDNYICQLCSQYGDNVHHIDYDKKNCNPNNLITLCRKCHTKTGHRREYWIDFFERRAR